MICLGLLVFQIWGRMLLIPLLNPPELWGFPHWPVGLFPNAFRSFFPGPLVISSRVCVRVLHSMHSSCRGFSAQLTGSAELCLFPMLLGVLFPTLWPWYALQAVSWGNQRIISFVYHFSGLNDILHFENPCLVYIFPFFMFFRIKVHIITLILCFTKIIEFLMLKIRGIRGAHKYYLWFCDIM